MNNPNRTEPNSNSTFTELEQNMNLIFKKYSEPEQNRTLIALIL